MQSDMLVQIAGISKRPQAELAFQRFVPCMSPNVNFQTVLSGITLPAIQANVSLFGPPQTAHERFHVSLTVVAFLVWHQQVLPHR